MKTLRISAKGERFLVHLTIDNRLLRIGPQTEEFLFEVFRENGPVRVVVGSMPEDGERAVELRTMILNAYSSTWKVVDVAKILAHPSVMREKVESIQRESERERSRLAASYLRRRLGLESGEATEVLAQYYEHEFRLHRAKEIEDAMVAGRTEEARRDLEAIGQDALVWTGWMLDANLFPFIEAHP